MAIRDSPILTQSIYPPAPLTNPSTCPVTLSKSTNQMSSFSLMWIGLCIIFGKAFFYRTFVYMVSDLWVLDLVSRTERFCWLDWCDSGWWRLNTNWLCYWDGLITDRVVRHCCQNWRFRNKDLRQSCQLPAHWLEDQDDWHSQAISHRKWHYQAAKFQIN